MFYEFQKILIRRTKSIETFGGHSAGHLPRLERVPCVQRQADFLHQSNGLVTQPAGIRWSAERLPIETDSQRVGQGRRLVVILAVEILAYRLY